MRTESAYARAALSAPARWLDGKVLPAFAGRILPIDHLVARPAAKLHCADTWDFGDPIIAATGLLHVATVVTRNIKHFQSAGVQLVNRSKH